MKARGKNSVHVFVTVFVVCLFVLTCTVYAAPSTAQKSTRQAQPAGSPASNLLNPNAPPKGTITITASSKGNVNASTWYTGSYQYIQWTCNGTHSNLVDVTLWQNNRQVVVIGTGIASGQTAYVVPLGTAPGSYEVRVTSEDDTRVAARFPVNILPTSVVLTTPQGALVTGSPYTITWAYAGKLQSVKLAVLDSSGAVVTSEPNISVGSNGKGSWPWTVPSPMAGKSSDQYRFQISAMLPTSVTSNVNTETVLGTSDLFTIRLPTIQVDPFLRKAGVAECSPGRQYQITWSSELNGKPVKVELYSAYGGASVQTIQTNIPSQASNSISWTVPSVNATLNKDYLNIRVTSLDFPSVKGEGDVFTCEKAGIRITSPDPQQVLVLNQTYQIGWQYAGDPGPHVRIDLLSSDTGGYNMQVFETPAQSTAAQGSSGKWGQGQFSWTLTNRAKFHEFYIQITGVENPGIWDRRKYATADNDATTSGTVSGSTNTGSSTQQKLTRDTSFIYNATSSPATFLAGSTVTLDANNYAVTGQLANDQYLDYRAGKPAQFQHVSIVAFSGGYVQKGQLVSNQYLDYTANKTVQIQGQSLVTFSNGYVVSGQLASNQSLEYRSGKSAQFQGTSVSTFNNGYVVSGQLVLGANQPLEYRSGKSATFTGNAPITFRSDGYVKSCQLTYDTELEYAPGQSKKWPAMTWPIFDDSGYTTTH